MLYLPKELVSLTLSLLDVSSTFALSRTSKTHIKHIPIKSSRHIHCLDAVENGYINLFKWLITSKEAGHISNNYEESYIITASGNGHLCILKYLRQTKCHWILRTHDLDVLKYLHENGCSILLKGDTYRLKAVEKGHTEILEYLDKIASSVVNN